MNRIEDLLDYEPIEPQENLLLATKAACLLIADLIKTLGVNPVNCPTLDRLVDAIEKAEVLK